MHFLSLQQEHVWAMHPFLHQGLVTGLVQVVLFIKAFLLCLPLSGFWRNGAERECAFEAMRGPHKHQSNTLWKLAKPGPMAIGLSIYPLYTLTVHKAYSMNPDCSVELLLEMENVTIYMNKQNSGM